MFEEKFTATIHSESIVSICNEYKYRYALKRKWSDEKPMGAFLCANPSKANELLWDNTVFKCNNLAVCWNWGGFYILNLWPNYSTDPDKVISTAETNELNAKHIARVSTEVPMLVLACGSGKKRQQRLVELIKDIDLDKLFCLGKNKDGSFRHPSRITPEDFPNPVKLY